MFLKEMIHIRILEKSSESDEGFPLSFIRWICFQTMDARDYFGKYAIERGTVIANPLTGTLPEPYKRNTKKEVCYSSSLRSPKES